MAEHAVILGLPGLVLRRGVDGLVQRPILGFGLFLCREILAITDITITEEGEAGKGAKFVMTLPQKGLRKI